MKTAVVTGGGSGIGRAAADRLRADGYHVATIDLNPSDDGFAHTADVTDRAQLEAPTLAISVLVQRPQGRTAYAVRREYTGVCVRARMRAHLWSPSYFTVSRGGAPLSIIKQYIDGQARPL